MNLQHLKKAGKIVTFTKGSPVFVKGDPGQEMFILLEGTIQIFADSPEKGVAPMVTLKKGDFFGEIALLDHSPRSTTAIAETDAILLAIGKAQFKEALSQDPGFAISIMKSLSSRLRKQTTQYAALEKRYQEALALGNRAEITADKLPLEKTTPGGLEKFTLKVAEVPSLPFPADLLSRTLLPPGHREYKLPEPESFSRFYLKKEKRCPLCKMTISVPLTLSSKLVLEKIEEDFRSRFREYEPQWHGVCFCPNCYYGDFTETFTNPLSPVQEKRVRQMAEAVPSLLPAGLPMENTIDRVFLAYYLAVQNHLGQKENKRSLAKLWLRLSWLYRDVEDWTMYENASLQAFSYYHADYYESRKTSLREEQMLAYLLGLFYWRFHNPEEARKSLLKAIVKNGGDKRVNERAYDLIQDIRSSR